MNDALAKQLVACNLLPDSFSPSVLGEDVYHGEVSGKIVSVWADLVKHSRESGYYPIIRGAADEFRDEPGDEPAAILERVPTGSIREILAPRAQALLESFRVILPELPEGTAELPQTADIDVLAAYADKSGFYSFGGNAQAAAWPADDSKNPERVGFHTVRELKGRAAMLSLVRMQHSYDIPAYLNFGGWNNCPEPELQVAALREWRTEHEARPACITGDVLECVVSRRPQTEAQSMKLAAEQWVFCEDIVGQGTQSVRAMAIEIWKSPTWFFWWD